MKLKSFGCSFIFGSELGDERYGRRITPSSQTWPALLAQHRNLLYECHAQPGSGNKRIAEQVLNQIATGEPAVYVIGWTWVDRFDFVGSYADQWQTFTPWNESELSQNYYRHLHSQYLDKLETLSAMTLVLNQLQRINAEFFMTYMDDLIFETKFHYSAAMGLMQDQLQPHLHTFAGKNFLDWSRSHGFAVGPLDHPLTDAHRAAAEYVLAHHNFS